jgi:broad specificity phosphatase PhoE
MAEVVLIRHAEPSLRGVFLGSTDIGLSEVGLSEARALKLDFDWPVYVSPMRRATETAEAMGLKNDFQRKRMPSWRIGLATALPGRRVGACFAAGLRRQ